jgi:hypothetical protein
MKALITDREGFIISQFVVKSLKSTCNEILDDLPLNSLQIIDELNKLFIENY